MDRHHTQVSKDLQSTQPEEATAKFIITTACGESRGQQALQLLPGGFNFSCFKKEGHFPCSWPESKPALGRPLLQTFASLRRTLTTRDLSWELLESKQGMSGLDAARNTRRSALKLEILLQVHLKPQSMLADEIYKPALLSL